MAAKTGAATGAVTQATLEAELKQQGEQLTKIRDSAVAAAGRRGGYGGGGELDAFLRRASLPRHGDVTVSLPNGFQPSHFTADGLQHHLVQLRADHARKIAAVREGAIQALSANYVRRADVDEAFAAAGLEPLAEKSTVTISGTVSFQAPDGVSEHELTEKLTEALKSATGSDPDISGVRLSTSRKLA